MSEKQQLCTFAIPSQYILKSHKLALINQELKEEESCQEEAEEYVLEDYTK